MRYVILTIQAVVFVTFFFSALKPSNNGYYRYLGHNYYRYNDNWYYYDILLDDWFDTSTTDYTVPAPLTTADRNSEYYDGDSWQSWMGASDWDDTSYYTDTHSSDSDSSWSWDSDSSWDWDSGSDWDWGGSDWDSDW